MSDHQLHRRGRRRYDPNPVKASQIRQKRKPKSQRMVLALPRIILYQLDYLTLDEHYLGILLCQISALYLGRSRTFGVIPACEALAAVVLGCWE